MKTKHLLFLLLISGLMFGFLFELNWYYIVLLLVLYLLLLKKIYKNQEQQIEEMKKFRQINAYMSQVSQNFVRNKNILLSLQETVLAFPAGKLHSLLLTAIDILLLEGGDIIAAEKKALLHLESNYPCERLHILHEYMLTTEQQGGECKREFILLEKMRLAWEKAILKYHHSLIETRNVTCILYGLMLLVCVMVLHAFPSTLSIVHLEFIQITNFVLTALLIVLFAVLDIPLCGQLFRKSASMNTQKEVEQAFPKWLFDLMLFIQQESLESAILHSISTAPPILQPELTKMSQLMLKYPGEISVFTSFLSEYELPQVEMNMRKLYALSIGTESKEESISFMIESNMDSLMKAEEKNYEIRGGLSSLFQFLPLLVTSLSMLIYCIAIIIVSLSHISTLL